MKIIQKVTEIVTSIMVLIAVVAVTAGVFYRYVLQDSLTYTFELSLLMYAYIIFFGVSMTLKNNGLIGVDIVTNFLNERGKFICKTISSVLMLIISLFMAYHGVLLVMGTGAMLTALDISIKWLYVSAPIGFFLFSINMLVNIVEDIKGIIRKEKKE